MSLANANYVSDATRTAAANEGRVALRGTLDWDHVRAVRVRLQQGADTVALLYPNRSLEDEVFGVYDGDVVLRVARANQHHSARMTAAQKDAGFVGGFTSLNGLAMPLGAAPPTREDMLKYWHDRLEMVGVADYGQKFSQDGPHGQTGFAIVKGGIKTMRNTGTKFIPQFAWVAWRLPEEPQHTAFRVEGVNKSRVVAATEAVSFKTLADFIQSIGEDGGTMLDVYRILSKHVIGQAMTSAQPGEKFDIKLGSYQI